ncbi:hypothetical protein FRZ03_20705 [Streptomyces misionensis]|uniref:Uncharacterized protein n=1 Tax=Streptomyces misionensis TaxID=67331 RepID=A0A5C6JMP5_9ACTN|nr:hypothetical protein [Streptomyces misionensis]TWV41819.1 hypothetical protein FRZ03_20705 [Streptomyces misionensis]
MQTSQSNEPCAPPSSPGPGGTVCDLVTVPARQGLEAVDILRRGAADAVGPVLHDDDRDTLGFLVPAGTAACWDVPGSTCTETDGRGLPPAPLPPVRGADWLLPPGEEADLATDPVVLREALGEAARLIEAADNCR